MNILRYFIDRPIATSLLVAGLTFSGIISYLALPVSGMPEIDVPTLLVTVEQPGASAETMAATVAAPLERQLLLVAGVDTMSSSSSQGVTDITLQFGVDRDIDAMAFEVQSAINAASSDLPRSLPRPPTIIKKASSDSKLLTLAVQSDTLSLEQVSSHIENDIMPRLQQVPGVSKVYFHGLRRPAVRVRINPLAVTALGISFEDVRRSIAQATTKAPKGEIAGTRQAFSLEANDQLVNTDDYANIIVAYRNGASIRLQDVSTVIDGAEDVRSNAWVNGKPAVTVELSKRSGFNVVATAENIHAILPELARDLPASIKLSLLSQRTKTIRASLVDMQFTLVLTIALVVLVVFLFLGNLRATIIPSIAIPLSLLGTFIVIHYLGFTLNNISLMALSIVIGFVVDDAVVMLENVLRHIELGESPLTAAVKGSQEITFTIVSMTVSLLAAFIPIIYMDGLVGRIFWEFGITAAVAILISGIVSLLVTPVLCRYFLRREVHGQRAALARATDRFMHRATGGYAFFLRHALAHPRIVLASLLLSIAGGVVLYGAVPKGFFPKQDSGIVFAVVEAPLDISFSAMHSRMNDVALRLQEDAAVANVLYYLDGGLGANIGRVVIDLKPVEERKLSIYDAIKRLKASSAKFVGVKVYFQAKQDVQLETRISKTEYQYTLRGASVAELSHWAGVLTAKLKSIPLIQDVDSDMAPSVPQLRINFDRQFMARQGITPQSVNEELNNAFGQRRVSSYFTQGNLHYVILEMDPQYQLGEEALSYIQIKSPVSGKLVPLSGFATIVTEAAPLTINHDGVFPAVTISFNLTPGHALGDAVQAIRALEAQLGLPSSLRGEFRGSAQAFQQSMASQPLLICVAILFIYIILGVLYESYLHPLTILSTLPSAGVGALGAHIVLNYEFSLISFIGILLLIGIVKKNGIMLVDFAAKAEREEGMTPHDAIFQACLLRFRPIMMTTLAALLGAIPLLLGSGDGAELRHPLGVTMIGGLLVSQVLTLFSTPVLYLYMSKLSAAIGRQSGRVNSDYDALQVLNTPTAKQQTERLAVVSAQYHDSEPSRDIS